MFKTWKTNNPDKTFADFEESPEYDKLRKDTEQQLIKTYKGVVVPNKFAKYHK